MKKLMFVAALVVAGMVSGKENSNKIESHKTNILINENVVLEPEGNGYNTYVWTSTCGIKHTTQFPVSWNTIQIANWVSDQNKKECGVRPKNVLVDIAPGMY